MDKLPALYSIEEASESKSEFQLRNLGNQTTLMIIGNRNSSKSIYRDVTEDDYDRDFAYRIMNTKPPYEVDKFLEFHYEFYTHNGGVQTTFFKHIKYVIIPILQKRENSGVQIELLNAWLNSKVFS